VHGKRLVGIRLGYKHILGDDLIRFFVAANVLQFRSLP
jgi:hypothetical protein